MTVIVVVRPFFRKTGRNLEKGLQATGVTNVMQWTEDVHDISYILRRKIVTMSVQVENLEKNMAKLTIEVAAEEVEKAIQAAYLKEKGKISMPGFRKGKFQER